MADSIADKIRQLGRLQAYRGSLPAAERFEEEDGVVYAYGADGGLLLTMDAEQFRRLCEEAE